MNTWLMYINPWLFSLGDFLEIFWSCKSVPNQLNIIDAFVTFTWQHWHSEVCKVPSTHGVSAFAYLPEGPAKSVANISVLCATEMDF